MREEVVGLGLVGVGANAEDGVGQLGIFVRVIELADSHVARGVTFRIVGRPIVNAHERRPQRAEHQLAGGPGVLKAAAGPAMIEAVKDQAVGTFGIEDALGQLRRKAPAPRPSWYRPSRCRCARAASSSALPLARPRCAHDAGQAPAACRGNAGVNDTQPRSGRTSRL